MKSLLTLTLFLAMISVTDGQTIDKSGWKSFTDTAGMFTASYPGNWVNKIKAGNRVFFTSPAENENDNFFENINIMVQTNPAFDSSLKLSELLPGVIEEIKPSFQEFKLEKQRIFQWNNREAAEIIYTGKYQVGESGGGLQHIRITQWFCFKNFRLYTLTYTAAFSNSSWLSTATGIMESIRFR